MTYVIVQMNWFPKGDERGDRRTVNSVFPRLRYDRPVPEFPRKGRPPDPNYDGLRVDTESILGLLYESSTIEKVVR